MSRYQNVALVLPLLCLWLTGTAQPLSDSLRLVINEMPADTNKVNYLNDLSRQNWRSNVDLAYSLAVDALTLSEQIEFQNGVCRSLNYIGITYTNKSEYDSARHYLEIANRLALNLKHKRYQYAILNSIGIVERKTGNYEKAIEAYVAALDFAEEIGTKGQVASILMNIGNIHFDFSDYTSAAKFYERSLKIFEELNNPGGVGHLLNNLGNLYGNLKNSEKSLEYYQKSLDHKKEYNDLRGIGTTHVNLGMLYEDLGDLKKSEYHFEQAVIHYRSSGASNDAVYAYHGLAGFNMEAGNLSLALSQAQKALEIADKHSMQEERKDINKRLANIYEDLGNYEEALTYYVAHSNIKDSLFQIGLAERISELEIKYETEKKERAIIEANAELQRKERFQLFLIIIIGTILLLGTILILLLVQRFKLRRALLSQEIDNYRIRINTVFSGKIDDLNLSKKQLDKELDKPLSDREYEILSLALSDKSNAEIAKTTDVSVNTIKFHLKNAYQKLGVAGRKEAMEFVITQNN